MWALSFIIVFVAPNCSVGVGGGVVGDVDDVGDAGNMGGADDAGGVGVSGIVTDETV